jgi:hypothetical protein
MPDPLVHISQVPALPTHLLLQNTMLQCIVCSSGTEQEALAWVQACNPAGTQHNWQIDERPIFRPIPCQDGGGRNHYCFSC